MTKNRVYVQGPAYYGATCGIFREFGYDIVTGIRDADIVVLTGGADIHPGLYNQRPIRGVYFNQDRDEVDLRAMELGVKDGKFLVGICRGAQLLNVRPNGGSLWQDVDRHNGTHSVRDLITGKTIPSILSVHHQMMRIAEGGLLVADTFTSTYKKDQDGTISSASDTPHGDPEVVWYPKTKSLCFQSHPEFGHPESAKYFMELMDRYYWRKNYESI